MLLTCFPCLPIRRPHSSWGSSNSYTYWAEAFSGFVFEAVSSLLLRAWNKEGDFEIRGPSTQMMSRLEEGVREIVTVCNEEATRSVTLHISEKEGKKKHFKSADQYFFLIGTKITSGMSVQKH